MIVKSLPTAPPHACQRCFCCPQTRLTITAAASRDGGRRASWAAAALRQRCLWRADKNWQPEKSLDCAISTPASAVIRRRYGEITPDQLLISLVGQAAAI